MAKGSEIFEHTADVGISAWGDSRAELYEALGEALADFMCPRRQVRPTLRRQVTVDSGDPGALAVDFLTELVRCAHSRRMCFSDITVWRADDTHLEAVVRGEPIDPARHELGPEIKAATYHLLAVRQDQGRWTGRVLLDL